MRLVGIGTVAIGFCGKDGRLKVGIWGSVVAGFGELLRFRFRAGAEFARAALETKP